MVAPLSKPAWRMRVAPNRLVPADAWTEEQLNLYPEGTELEVRATREKNTWRRRKEKRFWSILGKAVQLCRTPWTNSDAAADALKLALGVVDQTASTRGDIIRYPAQTRRMEDSEFAAFYEGAMAILTKITGVDPETLGREAGLPEESEADKDYRDDEPVSEGEENAATTPDDPSSAVGGDSGGDATSRLQATVIAETAGTAQSVPAADDERREAVRKMMALARDPEVEVDGRLANIDTLSAVWRQRLPEHQAFVTTVADTARRVARGELRGESASAYLVSLIK